MTLLLALIAALLEVHFVDVGQGDAAVIVSPERRVVVVDAGPPDAAAHVVRYLGERGIGPVDLLVASHAHLDHIGGAAQIVTGVGVKRYMDPGFAHPLDTYTDLLKLLEARKIPVLDATPGRKIALGDSGAVLEVLWPAKPFLSRTRSDVNSNSVVLRLQYRNATFLFMGDAEADTEEALVKAGAALGARVLKVAHHGSAYSSTGAFLDQVKPEHAVISCARGNSFGHPAPETLERLKKTKAQVWRTDRDGGIVFRTDGQSIDVEPGVTRFVPAPAATAGNGTQPAAAPPARVIPASGSGGAAIDLNAATEADLDALPGIGPSKARAIIEWRERNGPFTSVDQLDEVKGIGPALLEKIRPHVSVGPRPGAGTPAPAAAAAPGPAADTDLENEAPTGKVNINTAGVEELQTLQSVGPALAQRIIDHRRAHGPFRRIADLDAVKGVGASFLEKNKYFIAVKVDVNAAAEAELRAVGLSEKTARALVEARKTKPLRSAAELRALVPEAEWKAAGGLLWTGG